MLNLIKRMRDWLAALMQKRKLDAEMDEEMRAHVELRTRENLKTGMAPLSARQAALRQYGWPESIKEECHGQRGIRWLGKGVRPKRGSTIG
jgi:macrolide transport system ATP-binding/permease protein